MGIYAYRLGYESDPHSSVFKPAVDLAVMDNQGHAHDVTAVWRKSENPVDGTYYWTQVFPTPWQQIREEISVTVYKSNGGSLVVVPESMEFAYPAEVGNHYDWVAKGQDSVSTIHAIYEESWHDWYTKNGRYGFYDITNSGVQGIFVRPKYDHKYFVNTGNGSPLFTHIVGFEFYTSSLKFGYLNAGDSATQYFRFKLTGFKASAISPVLNNHDREYQIFPIGVPKEGIEIVRNTWVSHDEYDNIWNGGINDSI